MKEKIAYYSSSESWGGLEMNHIRDAYWMQERGHDVLVYCLANSPIHEKASELGLVVQFVERQKKYYDFKKARQLAKRLKKAGVSHLIIRSTYDISLLASVKYKLKNKIHTTYILGMQLGVKKKNLLHTIRYKFIDVWIVPLNYLADQVKNWTNYKNQLVLVPSGLDLSSFEKSPDKSRSREMLELPSNGLLFGLIGRFDRKKGQLLLIEAMSIAKNKGFSVVFLGEPTRNVHDNFYEDIQALIKEKGLEERIFIRPFRDDTGVFYKAVDWTVMATEKETYGMVTIESIACGTPVLGSNAGGTPELLRNETAGILFETMNAKALAGKIDAIIDQKISFDSNTLKIMGKDYDHSLICSMVEQALDLSHKTL